MCLCVLLHPHCFGSKAAQRMNTYVHNRSCSLVERFKNPHGHLSGARLVDYALAFGDVADVRWVRRKPVYFLSYPDIVACCVSDNEDMLKQWYSADVVDKVLGVLGIHPPEVAEETPRPVPVLARNDDVGVALQDGDGDEISLGGEVAPRVPKQVLQLGKLRLQKRRLTDRVAHWKTRALRAKATIKRMRHAAEEKKLTVGKGRYLSARGGFTLALNRCVGNMAAQKVGAVMRMDTAHTTVTRWEILLAASLIARQRAWFQEMKHALEESLQEMPRGRESRRDNGPKKFLLQAHCLKCDATTTAVWQKNKASQFDSSHFLLSRSAGFHRVA